MQPIINCKDERCLVSMSRECNCRCLGAKHGTEVLHKLGERYKGDWKPFKKEELYIYRPAKK